MQRTAMLHAEHCQQAWMLISEGRHNLVRHEEAVMFKHVTAVIVLSSIQVAAHAELIGFESGGYVEGDPVQTVYTLTNKIEFSITGGGLPYIAKVGNPSFSFLPADTPTGGNPGEFFLTDGDSYYGWDFYFEFESAITAMSLDIYDYMDGAAGPGSTATLVLFKDESMADILGYSVYTVPNGLPDGAVASVSANTLQGARAASLEFSRPDSGIGIDNIEITTVPAPSALILGLIGIGATYLKTKKQRQGCNQNGISKPTSE